VMLFLPALECLRVNVLTIRVSAALLGSAGATNALIIVAVHMLGGGCVRTSRRLFTIALRVNHEVVAASLEGGSFW
jgi:hypothetical protein